MKCPIGFRVHGNEGVALTAAPARHLNQGALRKLDQMPDRGRGLFRGPKRLKPKAHGLWSQMAPQISAAGAPSKWALPRAEILAPTPGSLCLQGGPIEPAKWGLPRQIPGVDLLSARMKTIDATRLPHRKL